MNLANKASTWSITSERNDVLQSDFKEDSDDVMEKMKTNHVLKSLTVDTS